jgi:hypothetical protein
MAVFSGFKPEAAGSKQIHDAFWQAAGFRGKIEDGVVERARTGNNRNRVVLPQCGFQFQHVLVIGVQLRLAGEDERFKSRRGKHARTDCDLASVGGILQGSVEQAMVIQFGALP